MGEKPGKSTPKRGVGRPSKLTPEVIAALEIAIRNGATIEDACVTAGIDRKTFYTWRELGEQGKKGYVEFLHIIKKAEIADKQWHINNIRSHAARSWQASAWYLERRYTLEYGRREVIEPDYGQSETRVKLSIVKGPDPDEEEADAQRENEQSRPEGEDEDHQHD